MFDPTQHLFNIAQITILNRTNFLFTPFLAFARILQLKLILNTV
ncbi:hypothetical protein ACFGY3_05805 [Pasteurella multocida]